MKTSFRLWRAVLGCLLVLLLPFAVSGQVMINEVLADNDGAYNNDGEFPDYVELYNNNTFPVDLAGWKIEDSHTNFIFKAGTSIQAKSYLIVHFDDNDNTPGIHTGFGLSDVEDRVTLWTVNNVLRDEVRFGFQVGDRSIGRVPDFSGGWVLCLPTPEQPNLQVPLGLRVRLRVNEWMPVACCKGDGTVSDDWFEIYNPETNAVNLSGILLRDSSTTNLPLPALSFIGPGGFLKFIADGNIENGINHCDFSLSSSNGDEIGIHQANGNLIHKVVFGRTTATNTSQGWLPDGNAGWDSTNQVNTGTVRFFAPGRDTPGDSNFLPIENVLINEVLTHTDLPLEDAIELYNPTTNEVNIGGWWLSNSKDDYAKYRIPTNTKIPPLGYKVFYEYLGQPTGGFNSLDRPEDRRFTLNSAEGDQVYLYIADANGNLTGFRRGVDFPAAENGVSFGRYINSAGESDFVPLQRLTFGTTVTRDDPPSYITIFRTGTGASNAFPKFGPLVVSEIMYHPPDIIAGTNRIDNDLDEFVEIYNMSTSTVHLWDTNDYPWNHDAYTNVWRVRGEVDFDFPRNMTMYPGETVVLVNFNPSTNTFQSNVFYAKYRFPLGTRLFGPYGNNLGNGGGTIEIQQPDAPQGPGRLPYEGYVPRLRVDKVNYNDRAPWPTQPDGGVQPNGLGYSLLRLKPELYGNDPSNWRAENKPSPGWQWVRIDSITPSPGSVRINFQGVAGSGYSILGTSNLGPGATWTKVQDVLPQTTSGARQVTISTTTPQARFFQIVTPMRP
jgi:hypothetical protein